MKKHFELEKQPTSLPYPLVGVIVLTLTALALGNHFDWRPGISVILGVTIGPVLYCVAFGFTSVWRTFISERRGRSL